MQWVGMIPKRGNQNGKEIDTKLSKTGDAHCRDGIRCFSQSMTFTGTFHVLGRAAVYSGAAWILFKSAKS